MRITPSGLLRITHDLREGLEPPLGAVQRAACVGASVERDRILRLIEKLVDGPPLEKLYRAVIAVGVRDVLGMDAGQTLNPQVQRAPRKPEPKRKPKPVALPGRRQR